MLKDGVDLLRVLSCVAMLSWGATSAAELRLFGNTSVQPNSTFQVRIALDAPLLAVIDDLELTILFSPTTFTGESATAGPLLSGDNVVVDLFEADGIGKASFLSPPLTEGDFPDPPQNGLSPGDLATWTFRFALGVTSGSLQVRLDTFQFIGGDILPPGQEDRAPTGNLPSNVLQIQVVPEPATYAFLIAGLATILFACNRRRQRNTSG